MLSLTALIALLGWIPIVVFLFLILPQRRATVVAFVLGWLFLPQASIPMPGAIPDYTRGLAISSGVLVAMTILDFQRLATFRPRWVDVPMAVFCLCPILSSLSNGLGFYDGLSTALNNTLRWGLPYFIGRMYFSDRDGLRQLAIGLFVGGLLYIPFCAYEIRMSPQLHYELYQMSAHKTGIRQQYRFGGWRPIVFMRHGLSVGMYMSMATLLGGWLWVTGSLRRFEAVALLLLGALALTTILCKSTGALLLLLVGAIVLGLIHRRKKALPLLLLSLLPVAYMGARLTDTWDGQALVASIAKANPARAQSLRFRLQHEEALAAKAMRRPLTGWGGWGRNRIHTQRGVDVSVTDGFWVIILGKYGLIGLLSYTLATLIPVWLFWRWVPPERWTTAEVGALTGVCVFLVLTLINLLPNSSYTPFTTLCIGGLGGLLTGPGRWELSRPIQRPRVLTAEELERREALVVDVLTELEVDPASEEGQRFRYGVLVLLEPAHVEALAAAPLEIKRQLVS